MTTGAYPISKFIQEIVAESGLRPSEFVARFGYRNTAKGLRRLNEWLEPGYGEDDCLERILQTFLHDPSILKSAIAQTNEMHEREHQESGTPNRRTRTATISAIHLGA